MKPAGDAGTRLGWWLALAAGGGAAMAVGSWRLGLRLDQRGSLAYIAVIALLMAGWLGATWLLLGGTRRHAVAAGAVAAGAALVGAVSLRGLAARTPWADLSCFPEGVVVAAVPAMLAILAVRRRAESGAAVRWLGAAAGLAAGVVGMAALHRHCALRGAAHGLLLHASVPLALAVAGAWAAGWRRAR